MLHARIAPVRSNRALVGDRLRKINARVLEAVHTRKNLRPNYAAEGLVPWISPTIVNMPGRDCGDDAARVQRHSSVPEGSLVAVRAGEVVLCARFNPLDRTPAGFS